MSKQWDDIEMVGALVVNMIRNRGPIEMHILHVQEPHRLKHEVWVCTAWYVENGAELGYDRLTVRHPSACACYHQGESGK